MTAQESTIVFRGTLVDSCATSVDSCTTRVDFYNTRVDSGGGRFDSHDTGIGSCGTIIDSRGIRIDTRGVKREIEKFERQKKRKYRNLGFRTPHEKNKAKFHRRHTTCNMERNDVHVKNPSTLSLKFYVLRVHTKP